MTDEEVVVIERYSDVIRAEFAQSVLQGSGIDAYIDIPHVGSLFPPFALTRGGVSLYVRAEDLERAREVLAEHDS